MREKNSDVFLGFSKSDGGLAALIATSLTDSGLNVAHKISGPNADSHHLGRNWMAALRSAIRCAKCVVVLLTPQSIESRWASFVTGLAMGLEKPLFFLIDGLPVNQLPDLVQQQQAVNVAQLPSVIPEIKAVLANGPVTISV